MSNRWNGEVDGSKMTIDAHHHLQEFMEAADGLVDRMSQYGISRGAVVPALNAPFVIDWLTSRALRDTAAVAVQVDCMATAAAAALRRGADWGASAGAGRWSAPGLTGS